MANQEINIVIKAVDKFTKNFSGLKKGLNGVNKKIKDNQATFKRMAGFGTAAFAGLTYGVKKLTDAYKIQESAEKQVAQGIKTTGGIAGKTLENLKKQASAFQKQSIFGDEDILQNVSAQFLTFGNITDEVFDRGQKAVLDLTTRLYGAKASGEQLRGTSIQLGKALNDPIKGVTALTRVGVAFTEQQKEEIKVLTESGNIKKAQALILKELEIQYGGSAKAAADALGPTHQLSKSFGDMKEVLGKTLTPAIDSIAEKLAPLIEKIAKWVNENPKLVKTIVLVTGSIIGLIAVVGTLGIVIPAITTGFGALATATGALGTALKFLAANPIGLVITAIGLLVIGAVLLYKNWDTVKEKAIQLGNYVLEMYEKYKILFSIFAPLIAIGIEIYKNWDTIKAVAISVGNTIVSVWNSVSTTLSEIWSGLKEGAINAFLAIKTGVTEQFQSMIDFVTKAYDKVKKVWDSIVSIKNKISNGVSSAVSSVTNTISGGKAYGGPVSEKKAYYVGERGPELFIPSGGGNIVSNDKLNGGQTFQVNITGNSIGDQVDVELMAETVIEKINHKIKMSQFGIS